MTDTWNEQAACLGRTDLMTGAATDELVDEAKAICHTCPVWSDCLDALAAIPGKVTGKDMHGIVAGGLTGAKLAEELRRRVRHDPTPISHGTPRGARAHYRRGEKPCNACRMAASIAANPDAYSLRTRWAS